MKCAAAVLSSLLALLLSTASGRAQTTSSLELSFTPMDRAQIAVWVEREDGTFMGTLALTHAVAKMGIGNRPGALQMNSGFRWPYGRREGVLPVWAHRRAAAAGAQSWKRVIFQDRDSEGFASRTADDMSPDHYYCLSFVEEKSRRVALDAVTCASVFSSDKGRFIASPDVARGYAEPYETAPAVGSMRALGLTSLYPPRRDVERCTLAEECYDHVDVASFRDHALAVMPELDAVSCATLQGQRMAQWTFDAPSAWPASERYKLFVEVNVEGDHNESFDAKRYPTPITPKGTWDELWAVRYGYPYRGQPSVVYALPFTLSQSEISSAVDPIGYGAPQGEDGSLTAMSTLISNDASGKRGSGADRLLLANGVRLSLRVLARDAPECVQTTPPSGVAELKVAAHREKRRAHMWANLSFKSPVSQRPIGSYVIEIKTDDGTFEQAFTPDQQQALLPVALDMCADPNQADRNRCMDMLPGTELSATLAGLRATTHYTVRVSARDRSCGEIGESATTEFTTPKQTFATVSPCFIATAAYGSPLAGQIRVLRALRDRQLANNALGRALIQLYYSLGPRLAEPVARHPWLARGARALLTPVVYLADWLAR
jgi:hypothetical protein